MARGVTGRQRRRATALLGASVAALWLSGTATAGYPVQPNGATVAGQPTFLVYVDDGETIPLVEVARSPDMTGSVGSCQPYTPFGEPHKFTCRLLWTLEPGTYYWTFSFWKNDSCVTYSFGTYCYPQLHRSAPIPFTIAKPEPPAGAGLVSPLNGASTGLPLGLVVSAPASADVAVYASESPDRNTDGSPSGLPLVYCELSTSTAGNYRCEDEGYGLTAGAAYYWWAVIEPPDGSAWVYGPWRFTVRGTAADDGAAGSDTGAGGSFARTVEDAPLLPSSDRYAGRSVKQKRLSKAAYGLTKLVRLPKSIAVGCWSEADWPTVSGDSGDGLYTTRGFFRPAMPHWVQLSPGVCRAFDTLLYHRPGFPNRLTAEAVETLTHEMMHALGISNEARAECYGMQLSMILAQRLGVPRTYAERLAHLNLANYGLRPTRYRDPFRCRENGEWDLFKGRNSPPWHNFAGI